MSDPHPAEEQISACGEQPSNGQQAAADGAGPADRESEAAGRGAASPWQGFEPDWTEVIDDLIGWAMARAEPAVDEICAYLAERPPVRPWQGDYPGESFPYLGRGHDQACSALRRRLRSQQGWAPRPMGARRPPRSRRVP
jgi:hypothetical protein